MKKSQKKSVNNSIKKSGTSYPDTVKQKIVSEIKSGLHSNRRAIKLYGLSRNIINSWVIQESLLPLTSTGLTQKPIKELNESLKVKAFSKQVIELQKALVEANLR